jgi:arylsulfatase A
MTPPYETSAGDGSGWIEVAPSFNDELVLETLTGKAVRYINEAASGSKKGTPFFLYLALTSPHLPHCTHPDFQGKSTCGNYGDFMMETDYRVGQVLDALAENGIENNTLVIFSADNGAETNYRIHREVYGHYSSYHFKGGKRDIYEGGHRVPFLMKWPEVIEAGSSCDLPVCQTDFFATIAEIVAFDVPDDAAEDSYSLLSVLRNKPYDQGTRGPLIHHSSSGYFAIRDGEWKLNLLRGSGGSLEPRYVVPGPDDAKYELYNMVDDPGETSNLYWDHPDSVDSLESRIKEMIANGRSTPGPTQPFVSENWPQVENLGI